MNSSNRLTSCTQALVLNNASRKQSTAGEMVNLMSIDTQRIVDLVTYFHVLWTAPIQILIAIYFLSVTMGISILAGVGILVLLIPINLLITRQARKQQVDITDIDQEYSVHLTLFLC